MVALRSTATGQEIRVSVDTVIGKYLLKTFAGEDAAFASEPQFRLYKDQSAGAWAVQHIDSAKNPTFCNGVSAVTSPALLKDGSLISIGAERLKLEFRTLN